MYIKNETALDQGIYDRSWHMVTLHPGQFVEGNGWRVNPSLTVSGVRPDGDPVATRWLTRPAPLMEPAPTLVDLVEPAPPIVEPGPSQPGRRRRRIAEGTP